MGTTERIQPLFHISEIEGFNHLRKDIQEGYQIMMESLQEALEKQVNIHKYLAGCIFNIYPYICNHGDRYPMIITEFHLDLNISKEIIPGDIPLTILAEYIKSGLENIYSSIETEYLHTKVYIYPDNPSKSTVQITFKTLLQ